jgi:hypothetical protein
MAENKPDGFGMSTHLRFDVTSLQGLYGAVERVTIRLTAKETQPSRVGGRILAHRLTTANAGWDSLSSWGTQNGNDAWAGGANGGLIPGTDYVDELLASTAFMNANPAGYQHDLVISGAAAQRLIDDWSNPDNPNEGFVLHATIPAEDKGNRLGLYAADNPDTEGINESPHMIVVFSAHPAEMTFEYANRASNKETRPELDQGNFGALVVGEVQTNNESFRTSSQLRFDVSELLSIHQLRSHPVDVARIQARASGLRADGLSHEFGKCGMG